VGAANVDDVQHIGWMWLVETQQSFAAVNMLSACSPACSQQDLPDGLDDETPPPLSKVFGLLKYGLKVRLEEQRNRGGNVAVAIQALQEQNRMMGTLGPNDELCGIGCGVCMCACW